MNAIEFKSQLTAEGALQVPTELAGAIPAGQPVRVIVLYAGDEDADWERLAAAEFGQGYFDGDSIYDQFASR